MSRVADTRWQKVGRCEYRAVCSAVRPPVLLPSMMSFTVCPDDPDRFILVVRGMQPQSAHHAYFPTAQAAKRAAANYIRGYRR